MEKDDRGRSVSIIPCFCGGEHCKGELIVQHDTINKKPVLMVTVVDTKGNDEGSMWLNYIQLTRFQEEIEELRKELLDRSLIK